MGDQNIIYRGYSISWRKWSISCTICTIYCWKWNISCTICNISWKKYWIPCTLSSISR